GVGGQTIPVRAEQAVNRQPRDLARDVPQGHVHRADGSPGGVTVAGTQGLIEALALERVLVHHEGLERAHQRLRVEVGAAARRAQEGVALDAVVGPEREEAELALAAELSGVPAVGRGRDVLPREQSKGDVGDLHEAPSRPRAGLSTLPRGYTDSRARFLLDSGP